MQPDNGKGDPGNPWGSSSGGNSGLDDLLRQWRDQINQFKSGGGSRGVIILIVIALIGLGAWTAYYTVPSDSVAVVQRFGRYIKEVPPGLHFKLPLGADKATV